MVTRNELYFCRIGVALIIWAAVILKSLPLLAIAGAILALSAILSVLRAPMILAYRYSFGRIRPGQPVLVDVAAYRFAHSLGTLMACIAIALTFTRFGWGFALFFAIIKSVSAAGFCPAAKLFTCMRNGGCCALSRKASGGCNCGTDDKGGCGTC